MAHKFFVAVNLKPKISASLFHYYIGLSIVLFLIVELWKRLGLDAPDWFFFYFNDFLVIPIVAYIARFIVVALNRNPRVKIPVWAIVFLVAVYTFYFEVYLPRVSSRYAGDFWDVICYVMGGFIFYGLQYHYLQQLEKLDKDRRF